MSEYRVELDAYQGPLDLLLFLIRRDEIDIYDIPIAHILDQYLAYVELLKFVDPNTVGEFLVMAATLMEIKSRTLLPHPPPEEEDEELIDPRQELVRQLLQYKTFKDAARHLGVAAEMRALKHVRQPIEPPEVKGEVDLENVQIWDLFTAFKNLLEQTGQRRTWHEVIFDDTPITLHAADITDFLSRTGGSQSFETIFEGRTRGQMIGLFLALLELIRQRRVRVEQEEPFAPIIIHLISDAPIDEPVEAEAREDEDELRQFMESDLPEWMEVEELEIQEDAFLSDSDRVLEETERRVEELERRMQQDSEAARERHLGADIDAPANRPPREPGSDDESTEDDVDQSDALDPSGERNDEHPRPIE